MGQIPLEQEVKFWDEDERDSRRDPWQGGAFPPEPNPKVVDDAYHGKWEPFPDMGTWEDYVPHEMPMQFVSRRKLNPLERRRVLYDDTVFADEFKEMDEGGASDKKLRRAILKKAKKEGFGEVTDGLNCMTDESARKMKYMVQDLMKTKKVYKRRVPFYKQTGPLELGAMALVAMGLFYGYNKLTTDYPDQTAVVVDGVVDSASAVARVVDSRTEWEYACYGETFDHVSKNVSGSRQYAKQIVDYNKQHNDRFRYGADRRCYGPVQIPGQIVKNRRWVSRR